MQPPRIGHLRNKALLVYMHIIGAPPASVAIRWPQFVFFFFYFCLIGGLFLRFAIIYDFSMVLIVLFCLSTSRLGNTCISPDTRGESSFIVLFTAKS